MRQVLAVEDFALGENLESVEYWMYSRFPNCTNRGKDSLSSRRRIVQSFPKQKEVTFMEKKTMGAFLAALRKANGMTQKDLAEKLNVSDKSVSRWECDDGAPDLSLIPVIAEIFGITCDELLRGERKAPEERTEAEDVTPKGEKQRRRLLAVALSRYRT